MHFSHASQPPPSPMRLQDV